MASYESDLVARRKAPELVGKPKSIKKSNDAVIAQLMTDILDRLEVILSSATHPVSIVFYNTMKGDYYHFMAEYLTDYAKAKQTVYHDKALSAFMTGKESATASGMSVIDPFFLELHFSVPKLYYLMKLYSSGRWTNFWVQKAARECEDELDEESRKLSEAIKERMRKTMNGWIDEKVFGSITY